MLTYVTMLTLNEMAVLINTVESYVLVVEALFDDDIYNYGRLLVLSIFTDLVCSKHPTLSCDIRKEHCKFLARLNSLNLDAVKASCGDA